MAIEITDLSNLPDDVVDDAYALAQQLVLEAHPTIDSKRGVIGQLVIGLGSILGAAHKETFDRLLRSMSLLEINKDPALADDDTVDQVISNYRISRKDAAAAVGEVTIVLDQLIAVTIPAGSVFTAGDVEFTSDTSYAARIDSSNVLLDTDRLITQIDTDRYAFTINVTATTSGSAGMLSKDTALIPQSPPTNFVSAYAASDFTQGQDAQTNQDLIDALEAGMATRAYSNRTTLLSMLINADASEYSMVTSAFSGIYAVSVVGFGDPEMFRDQHWLFPVSGGGRTDIYLRSQALPVTTTVTKTATLVAVQSDGGVWQLSLNRDDAPGFYEATRIVPSGADANKTGYEVTSDTRTRDLTGNIYIPDIQDDVEAVYSRYQSAVIQFLDTDTDVSGLTVGSSTADYDVSVSYMPLVDAVQDFVGDRRVRNPAGDHLVKAAVPCFLSLSFSLERRNTSETVDTSAIQSALAEFVNKSGFPGRLYASALQRIIDESLPDNIDAGAIDMFGRIRRPDGTYQFIRDDAVLEIPDQASNMTSPRTVVFFLDPSDIAITEVNVSTVEV